MSLDLTHEKLGWPLPNEVRTPSGEGARIFAELAQAKIEKVLALRPDASGLKVGVLARNSQSRDTESPLAVVAEFKKEASDHLLRELHRLAWNFSLSPTVVTIEPNLVRVWTCCEPPEDRFLTEYVVHGVSISDLAHPRPSDATKRAIQVLHWANLVSGQFFRDQPERFRREKRADHMLLENLRHLRNVLRKAGLTNDDVCHDLLARVILVQFLFHRKDSAGNSALNANKLAQLHEDCILKTKHPDFASILNDYEDAYRLFDWLNDRFNGDLFPGKGNTKEERERAWVEEKSQVKSRHLEMLRDFVKGDLDMPTGQLCLWPAYSFDAIPLEFVSSIYEAFVAERARRGGIYYTPPHLVDFILDRVLPWDGDIWDLKVLDPACGSGIFLVKAFQRLIHRWKNSHPDENIRADTLRRLLEKNLLGVDKDPHAVRVASFSLYLAMCDEIDPKHYWTQVHFPPMRNWRLINSDFFEESHTGFRTKDDAATYDLVIGNAPWGEELLTTAAEEWANEKTRQWPVANKGIGTLFLPKAAALTKPGGRISMIQSASSLLFNRSGPACQFRNKFFKTFRVEEVVNLSALRFKVFNHKTRSMQKSIAPACIITFNPEQAANDRFGYLSPKQVDDFADEFDLITEPAESKALHPADAAESQEVWTALMWGNRRDWSLVQRLKAETNLEKLRRAKIVTIREGIIPSEKGTLHPGTRQRLFWYHESFPEGTFLRLKTATIERSAGIKTHRRTALDAFDLPQLTVKQGWQESAERFAAALTPQSHKEGVLFTQSYLSIRLNNNDEPLLEAACLSYNSVLAVYFLLLTSSRFASYRPEPLVKELLRVPIPVPKPKLLENLSNLNAVDRRIREAFEFKDAEWVLIEDLFDVTLADFKGDESSPGRLRTRRNLETGDEPQLRLYCEYFIRVLKAGFGPDKKIVATVFHENGKELLPYRLVAIHLNSVEKDQIRIQSYDSLQLLAELETVNRKWLKQKTSKSGSIYSQRVARIYDDSDGNPTIYIFKPDAYRYWTRSMGLHDADEVAADFARWNAEKRRGKTVW